jgi:exosome complex RNA-binding protein Rrp42 (RNase PH superfamily)
MFNNKYIQSSSKIKVNDVCVYSRKYCLFIHLEVIVLIEVNLT